MRLFRPIYDRVLEWSRHRHARRYLAGLSFAEATFFPVPPDVMLAPMVLAERDRAWRLATLTTVASVIGGLAGYLIGWLALDLVLPLVERFGYLEAYASATRLFERWGIAFVIVAGFTPIPFKIITIAGGALLMPLPGFIVGSLVGRGARFFLVAALIRAGGVRMADRLRDRIDLIGWIVVALALVAAIAVLVAGGGDR